MNAGQRVALAYAPRLRGTIVSVLSRDQIHHRPRMVVVKWDNPALQGGSLQYVSDLLAVVR